MTTGECSVYRSFPIANRKCTHFPEASRALKTAFAWLLCGVLPMNRLPLGERLLAAWSSSKTVCVELLAKPKGAPLLPTFQVAPARPALLTLNPYAAAVDPPSDD